MQSLVAMLARLQESLDEQPPRAAAAAQVLTDSRSRASRFPLVHRTGSANIRTVLAERRLTAGEPCTEREIRCGIPSAAYFFLGCAAYPEGSVAFLAHSSLLNRARATFTPFDTGSLEKYARVRDQARWEALDKDDFLAAHLGQGCEAIIFAGDYVAAHFKSPADYVRRPQRSEPDFPTYHGLESTSGDRRAWSIEIQLHDDLPIDTAHIAAIVVGQHDRGLDIPDELFGKVISAESDDDIAVKIHNLIAPE